MIKDIQQEILRLKKEKDICILAHSYVAHEIIEIADFTGDSYALSVKATTAEQKKTNNKKKGNFGSAHCRLPHGRANG